MDEPIGPYMALLIKRIHRYPPEALERMIEALERIEKKYGLLTKEEELEIERNRKSIETG